MSNRDESFKREQEIVQSDDSKWYSSDDNEPTGERNYVLPFASAYGRWSPWDIDHATFGADWLDGMLGLILQRIDQERTRPSRVVFDSSTFPSDDDRIGCVFRIRHDQTGVYLGSYKVVGIIAWGYRGHVIRAEGEVPDVKLAQATYK